LLCCMFYVLRPLNEPAAFFTSDPQNLPSPNAEDLQGLASATSRLGCNDCGPVIARSTGTVNSTAYLHSAHTRTHSPTAA
jgi:hypothetical protein